MGRIKIPPHYKCVITNGAFNDIHHLYSFESIVKDSLSLLGFDKKRQVQDYTKDDLMLLMDTVIKEHYKPPLGVCINRKDHKLFHKTYGFGNNTPDQWSNFIKNYI